MDPDKILIAWYRKNKETLSANGMKSLDDVIGFMGWPSEEDFQPYLEDGGSALNTYEEDLGLPLPKEIMQYKISKWLGREVKIDHPLVVNPDKWRGIEMDSQFDSEDPIEYKQYWLLVYNSAGPEFKKNMGSYKDVTGRIESPEVRGKLYYTSINGVPVSIVAGDDSVAFLIDNEKIKIFDYDGNRLYKETGSDPDDYPKVISWISGYPGLGIKLDDLNQLHAILGNKLANLVIGKDDISVLDLP